MDILDHDPIWQIHKTVLLIRQLNDLWPTPQEMVEVNNWDTTQATSLFKKNIPFCVHFTELQHMGRRERWPLWARHHSSSAHTQWGYLKDVLSPNTALHHSPPLAQHAEVIHWVGRAIGPKAGARLKGWGTSDEPRLATESGYYEVDSITLPRCRSKTLGCLQWLFCRQHMRKCFTSWCTAIYDLFAIQILYIK